ncbi:hypothetical protein J1N11_19875 [Marinilabiliaceae bacterium N1Y90]|nr:hypothetical protein [Marinilabiliaceae bacterium N1Y90]
MVYVNAQNSGNVSMSFVKGDVESKVGEFASNVLKVYNGTASEQTMTLMVNPPAGWKLLGQSMKEIIVSSNDTLFIPVRLKPVTRLQGDMTYVTNAFLSMNGFSVGNAIWNIQIKKTSAWNASLSSNTIYFPAGADSSSFYLQLVNGGNADEDLVIKANTESGIQFKGSKENSSEQRKNIRLKVGQDTLLFFDVVRVAEDYRPDFRSSAEQEKRYRLKVEVKNQKSYNASGGRWTGNVNFLKLSDSRKVEESIFSSFPLTVEWNSFNVLSDNTFGSLGLYGYKSLSNSRNFTYYYQSTFVQNEVNWNSLLGNYFYVGYFSPLYNVEVGDITAGRSGSLLIGQGLKASYKYKQHRLGGLYIGNPSPFDTPFLSGYGAFYKYSGNGIRGEAYFESTNHTVRQLATNYATADVSYRINNQHNIQLGGGYSIENYSILDTTAITGYRAMLGYQGVVKGINISANGQYNTEAYAPRRGVVNGALTLAYQLKPSMRLRGGASFFSNQPSFIATNGTVSDTVFTRRSKYFAQLMYTSQGHSYVIKPEYITYATNQIETNTGGLGFEYRTRLRTNTSFFANVFAGQNSFQSHPDVDPIFVSNIRLSLRYKRFNTNIRYYYGPFFLNEQLIYVNTLDNPQRLFLMANYEAWLAKNKMRLNLNLNYNYTTIQGRHQLVTRPELFYYLQDRFQVSVYANFLLYANDQYERTSINSNTSPVLNDDYIVPSDVSSRIEFGFGLKFNINVPAGIDRNYRATLVVFRDLNGNGVKDRDEIGFENMLVRLTPTTTNFTEDDLMLQQNIYELISNEEGKVEYQHLPKGNYKVETISLMATEGWFGGSEFYKYIDGNQIISIPLSKGARLSGGIFVERGEHSDDKPIQLGGIRVSAINQLSGEPQTTLTDQYGNYSLYLPNGDYIISINEGAVGTRYQFVENNIPLTVTRSGQNYNVGFHLTERSRTINFGRKSGSNAILRTGRVKDNRDENNGRDPNLMPISTISELGQGHAVRLFNSTQQEMMRSEFDTLQTVTAIYCIVADGGDYWYQTAGLSKKSAAKKLLKKIKNLGFMEANIVELTVKEEETTVNERSTTEVSSETITTDKAFRTISSDDDRNKYRVQIESTAIEYSPIDFEEALPDIAIIYKYQEGDMYYYSVGEFASEKEAKKYLKSFKKKYKTSEAEVRNYAN